MAAVCAALEFELALPKAVVPLLRTVEASPNKPTVLSERRLTTPAPTPAPALRLRLPLQQMGNQDAETREQFTPLSLSHVFDLLGDVREVRIRRPA